MQLSQSVKLKQKQSLVMTPQLQQAIKLLQLSNLELTQHLQEQVDENPFLELQEPKIPKTPQMVRRKQLRNSKADKATAMPMSNCHQQRERSTCRGSDST